MKIKQTAQKLANKLVSGSLSLDKDVQEVKNFVAHGLGVKRLHQKTYQNTVDMALELVKESEQTPAVEPRKAYMGALLEADLKDRSESLPEGLNSAKVFCHCPNCGHALALSGTIGSDLFWT